MKIKNNLKEWEIVIGIPDVPPVMDEIDPKHEFGITPIGFQYRSKLTGNNVIVHPAMLDFLAYKVGQF